MDFWIWYFGMAWIRAFLGWTEKDIDTGHGLILGLRARLFSSLLLLLLLGQLRLYHYFLAEQSGSFTLKLGPASLHFHRKIKFWISSYYLSQSGDTHKHKHTYNLKRYTLPMQTSKEKKQHSRPNEGIQICHHHSCKSSLHTSTHPTK